MDALSAKSTPIACFHCGDACPQPVVILEEKSFCCEGCKTVYQILHTHKLETYYELASHPGLRGEKVEREDRFAYLDHAEVQEGLIDFRDETTTRVRFFLPQIHCSSCIWLLENLHKLHPAISSSRVQFLKKEMAVSFAHAELSLRELVELLASIGYAPSLNLNDLSKKETGKVAHSPHFYYQLGVAGFCFGNIMLLSFPEYLGLDSVSDASYGRLFSYLNLLLALPVFLYSAADYFRSAWYGLRHGNINIDLPISLGILVLFLRSAFDILSHSGAGYFDSMAGLVFLLLIGKWFQNKTYDAFSFERDYESYFPIAVTRLTEGREESVPVKQVMPGDRLLVRSGELIPADALLLSDQAEIDYSFVTGEARPVGKVAGDLIYAGGRQTGAAIRVQVQKEVSQSYLTQLWNQEAFVEEGKSMRSVADRVGQYFTVGILVVATLAGLYWYEATGFGMAANVFTAVMIIACPCAIALTIPFTLGNAMRILGRAKLYVKNTHVIERMASVGHIVFDKTGTLTYPAAAGLAYQGSALSEAEKAMVYALTSQSSHPVSRSIATWANAGVSCPVEQFAEVSGKGLMGTGNGHTLRLGSSAFVDQPVQPTTDVAQSGAFLSIDGELKGRFVLSNQYREGMETLVETLEPHWSLSLLSGDNDGEKSRLGEFFPASTAMHFDQSPQQKLDYIRSLQDAGQEVLMVGDGLNDAGALRQSEVGIAVSEHVNNFSPASDAILDAQALPQLASLLGFAKTSMRLVRYGFLLSLVYNLTGLAFAVQGLLSPLVAAILMPLSSITLLVFAVSSTRLAGRHLFTETTPNQL